MNCYIFCSSSDCDADFIRKTDFSDSFVICADGGLNLAEKNGVKIDLWVGDNDSSSSKNLSVEKIVYPAQKDLTDTHIAVNEALNRGYKDIFLVGATGGRLDHEFANYCLLKYILEHDGFGTIINPQNYIFMTDKGINISPKNMKYISFFPFGGNVTKFSVDGAKYSVDNYTLTDNSTYTVSNEFVGKKDISVKFEKGYLLVMCSKDK